MTANYDILRKEAQEKIDKDIYKNGWPEGCDLIRRQMEAIEELRGLCETLRSEAQIHAQEAATQRSTVQECYRAVTQGGGEPGDWSGAKPVVAELARLRKAAELHGAVELAAAELPSAWSIVLEIENGSGMVLLNGPGVCNFTPDDYGSVDSSLAENIAEAVAYAKEQNS